MDPAELLLFYQPKDRLRLTIGNDRSYRTVRPVWAAPMSRPNRYLALLDGKGDEIALIPDPNSLSKDSLSVVKEELRRRYLTATVTRISKAVVEFGATYWHVETDRGPRDFVAQNLQENAVWLSERHLLMLDVDGNRFEIPDIEMLDERSKRYIHSIL